MKSNDKTLEGKIHDWYWKFGVERQKDSKNARWAMQQEELFDVCDKACQYEILKARLASGRKPAIALWGLSQGGKSMLLQKSLDFSQPAKNGFHSALQWHKDDPVVFKYDGENPDICLNPNEQGNDATACITRFVLKDEKSILPERRPAETRHPVEITLLDNLSLLKTLAVGYAACLPGQADDPDESRLTQDKISSVLDSGRPRKLDELSCPDLMDFISVLHVAREQNKNTRYRNISARFVKSLRGRGQIPADMGAVHAAIFWDNDDRITTLYNKARAFMDKYKGREIRCSHAVARVLVNMQTYAKSCKASAPSEAVMRETLDIIGRIDVESSGNLVMLRLAPKGQKAAFPLGDPEDFVTFQSIIREIVIPVNADSLKFSKDSAALLELLEKNDLLDFPGITWVAQKNAGAGTPASTAAVPGDNIHSDIVKLGKTLSAASISAFESVDEFCAIINLARHKDADPAKSAMLRLGMERWRDSRGKGRMMAALTFLGDFIQKIEAGGTAKARSGEIMNYFDPLTHGFASLIDPKKTDVLFVHYVISEANAQNTKMLQAFAKYINAGDGLRRLREKFGAQSGLDRVIRQEKGVIQEIDGRESLLRLLASRIDKAQNENEIAGRMESLRTEIMAALDRLQPRAGEQEQLGEFTKTNMRLVGVVTDAIDKKTSLGDGAIMRSLSASIGEFTQVDHDVLALDISVLGDRAALRAYRDSAPSKLAESAKRKWAGRFAAEFGLGDSADFDPKHDTALFIDRFLDVLSLKDIKYKRNGVDVDESALVLIANELASLHIKRLKPAQHSQSFICETIRLYFALKLEDNLRGRDMSTVRPKDGLPPKNDSIDIDEEPSPSSSPYYETIQNFKARVKMIEKLKGAGRGAQAGDAEISNIISGAA